ncbi:hypothetical protein MWU65_17425 [Cellulophaga sp. F20128]|uniref:hypothetical protein n=1 Tax=Cellulophaga sp. F20128 TaxID=2926413 RepID=UPI001FF45D18|nr:hypothetical protein [Cellulophaga sp. F20128]MCK0158967.1 hypothetical protein [Cellulophaga sp. F20128]
MQKVITITTHTNIIDKEDKFTEKEYPKLSEYLENGYSIKEAIPIIKPADPSLRYAITFILEK